MEKMQESILHLNDDLCIAKMDPSEAHAYLLQKVKTDQGAIAELEKKGENIDKEIRNTKAKEHKMQAKIDQWSIHYNNKGGGKFTTMFWKEKEITDFLQMTEETLSKMYKEQTKTESTIIEILTDISKGIMSSRSAMPTRRGLDEMK